MKKRSQDFFYIMLCTCVLMMFYGCRNDKSWTTCPATNGSTVQLTTDYIACSEVWLKLKFTDNNAPRGFALLRDGKRVFTGTIVATDTMLVDTSTSAGHTYNYIAQRINGSLVTDSSSQLHVSTLDSTSHLIQWQVDTLGALGAIRDIWIFSRDNVLAVGQINLIDSNGQVDMSNPYAVAKWNGQIWMRQKIYDTSNQIIVDIRGIYAFNNSDIWLADGGIHHWNGVSTKMTASYDRIALIGGAENGQSINKLWGTNTNNLFGVGYKGMISHFDGHTWTKMASNTTVDLQDIYGLDADHIWAAGMNSDGNGTVILSFDGANWQKLYEGNYYGFSSVWTNEGTKLFIDGDSGPWSFILNTKSFIKLTTPAKYVMYCVRATNVNDIFFTGQNNEITHFNGLTFLLYQNIQGPNSADIEWRTIKATKDFVVAGGDYYFGYNSAPLILRGYR